MAHIKKVVIDQSPYLIEPTLYITPSLINGVYSSSLEDFTLDAGVAIQVQFPDTNPANAQLKINNDTKNIYYDGGRIALNTLKAGHVYTLVYDGQDWQIVGDIDTDTIYTHPTTDGNLHVPATGTTNNGKFLKAGSTAGSASWQSITKNDITDFPNALTPTSHIHGNIQNGGTLQTNDVTIADGDKLVITDTSDNGKIARASISFDGATATKALTQKGTWETFNNYSLPLAANGTRGGIQIGYNGTGKNYAVQLDNEKAYVNVPWTDQNVTQSADTSNNDIPILLKGTSGSTTVGAVKYPNTTGKIITVNPSTGAITAPGGFMGNASSATQAYITHTVPTSATSYYITAVGSTTNGNQGLINNELLRIYLSANGANAYLNVGNSTKYGGITLHSGNGFYGNIITETLTTNNKTYTLPNKTGTIALTSDIPTTMAWSSITGKPTKITLTGDVTGEVSLGDGNLTLSTTANHTYTLSIATDTGTSALTMYAATKYKLTAGGSTYIFTTQDNAHLLSPIELTNEDLDDYKTAFKTYYGGGSNEVKHKPDGVTSFGLTVKQVAANYRLHDLITSGGTRYYRIWNNSSWSAWTQIKLTDTTYTVSSPLSLSSGNISFSAQTHNTVLAGPSATDAANAAPTFRSLTINDLPTITIAKGGTNITTYTLGDILYASKANTLHTLAGNKTTTRKFLRSVGASNAATAPVWDTVTNTDVGLSNVTNHAQVTSLAYDSSTGILSYKVSEGTAQTIATFGSNAFNSIDYLPLSGGTMTGNIYLDTDSSGDTTIDGVILLQNSGTKVIQLLRDSSNWGLALGWDNATHITNTYLPGIGYHNTGKTISIVPYATNTSPWNRAVGLSIGETTLKFENNLVAHAGNVSTGDSNGQIKIAGQNVTVKGISDLAYISKGSGSTKFLREDGTWQTALTSHQSLSAYAKLASPAFTGTPTAPTAANGTSTTQIATTAFVTNTLAYANAMTFKGTLGTGGTITELPATHEAGDTYRVITPGTWAGKTCVVGDLVICVKDGTTASDADWTSVETNEDGAVIGPAEANSTTDNAVVRWDSTTGRVIQNSKVIIDDNGCISTTQSDATDTNYKVTNSKGSVGIYTSTNRGLYDFTKSNWIIYRAQNGNNTYIPQWASTGTATAPVYFNENGEPTAGNTYAGGTKVTLNGTAKGASTASFYAPTTAGTAGQYLKSTAGAPEWATFPSTWTPSSHTHGNITNDGKISETDTIGNNYRLVIVTPSNASTDADKNKVITSSIVFDASTETECLTKKGTWKAFNNYSHPTDAGNKHIPSGGSTGQFLKYGGSSGTATWSALPTASTEAAGIIQIGTGASNAMAGNTNVNNVFQDAITYTDYTNWRPLIWGNSNSGTEGFTPGDSTAGVFSAASLTCQPSTGTIRIMNLKLVGAASSSISYTEGTNTKTMISFIKGDANGHAIKIGGGALTVIGAGESAANISPTATSEQLYLLADKEINIEANADTIGNRLGIQINTSGHVLPIKTESINDLKQDLGSDSARWANVYANVLKLQGASSNPSTSGGARIEFTYDSSTSRLQPVYIAYTPNDSYRAPAGLKIMGGTSATPAWFEVEGALFSKDYTHFNSNGIVDTTLVMGTRGKKPTATTTDGTTTYSGAVTGTAILTLGNNKVSANSASGVDDNAKGYLRIYGASSGYGEFTYNDTMFNSDKSLYFSTSTNSGISNEVRGICATNDYWRVAGGATASNSGYMEIATADDGNEPIYVRQYTGVFTTLKRTATLLDASGNTEFPVQVTAPKFIGALTGNASSATALANSYTSSTRPTNANITHVTNGGIVHFKATSSMNTNGNKPANDGNILHFHWDTGDAWDAQLYVPDGASASMQYRGSSAAGTWGSWKTLLDSNNTASGTNNTATLTWSTSYTIAKINGTDIKFTTMAKPTYAFTDLTSHPTTLSGYGITDAMASNTVVNKVKQTSDSTSKAYKVLFSTTNSPTSGNDYETYYGSLTYNPSTKALVSGGTVDGLTLTAATTGFTIKGGTTAKTLTVGADYTLAAACAKSVDTSISAASTSANLPTSAAVATFVEGKGYLTSHYSAVLYTASSATGKAQVTAATSNPYLNLVENSTVRSTTRLSGSGATSVTSSADGKTITISSTDNNDKVSQSASTSAKWRKILLHHKEDDTSTADVTSQTDVVYSSKYVAVSPNEGKLRATTYIVEDKVTLQWNSTDQSLDFIFA